MLRIRRDERGQSLVIVLSLITLLFLLGSSLAVHASVALRTTRTTDGEGDEFYAADAATELGIWWQRNGKAGNPPNQTINGITASTTITPSGGGGGSCPADNTPVWMNGFEMGTVPGVPFYGNAGASSGVIADTSVVRTGAYSARVSPAGASTYISVGAGVPFGQVTVLHEAFQFAALPGADAVVTDILANLNLHASLYYKASTGKWTVAAYVNWSGRTEVSGTVGPVAGQWQRIDIRYQEYVNPVVIDWSIDGVAQPQLTMASAGSTTGTGLTFGQAANTTTATYTGYLDDIFVSATSSDFPLPDIRINVLKPNAMGTHNTPANYQNDDSTAINATSWQRVDDIPMTPTTDFIKEVTAGAGSYTELAFEDTTQTCVRGASLFAQVRSAATQANNQTINSVTNGVSYTIWSGTVGSTTAARYVQRVVSQNAASPGVGPWTQAVVNGIVARWGLSTDASPNPYLDGIVLEYAWISVVASPLTYTIVGTGGGSTVSTSYTDAGAGIPSLTTWTTTK